MAITTFDTLKFVRRLEQAGVPLEQAEVQAEVLTEAFNVNLESLVTKEYFESRLSVRFAEQGSCIDTQFNQLRVDMKKDYAELNAKIDGNFRVFLFTQAIVVAAVVISLVQSFIN